MAGGEDEAEGLLRFLAAGPARPASLAADGTLRLTRGRDEGRVTTLAALDGLAARGLVLRDGDRVALSAQGAKAARSAESAPARGEREPAASFNPGESPLALLAARRMRDGSPFLLPEERDAGERLRADYDRAQYMPRLGIAWDAVGGRGGDGGRGGIADLTDAALAARQRAERAIDAVGPELAGVLVDVCCFLKGLERVEFERGWPARSAKIVLKSALGALARHYCPEAGATGSRGVRIFHWGSRDYRPNIASSG